MATNHKDPSSYHPLHTGMLVPDRVEDFDFGAVLDQVLGDVPARYGEGQQPAAYYYDVGVQRWLSRIFSLDGHTVPLIMAAPMNAFASYRKILVDSGRLDPCACDRTETVTLPLPMVSVQRQAHRPRDGSNPFPIRNAGFVDDVQARAVNARYGTIYTRYPKPVWFPYRISIWALEISHLQWLVQRMEETFWDHLAHFRVESPYHHSPQGLVTAAKKIGAEDLSTLERGTEERLLRFEFSIDVEAWIFYDSLRGPTVHSVSQEVLVRGSGPDAEEESAFISVEELTDYAKVPLHLQTGPSEPVTDGVHSP